MKQHQLLMALLALAYSMLPCSMEEENKIFPHKKRRMSFEELAEPTNKEKQNFPL